MEKPMSLIGAGIRGACGRGCQFPDCDQSLRCSYLRDKIKITLRSIKPRDPTEEWLNHAFMALEGMESDAHLRVYRDALWHELYDQES